MHWVETVGNTAKFSGHLQIVRYLSVCRVWRAYWRAFFICSVVKACLIRFWTMENFYSQFLTMHPAYNRTLLRKWPYPQHLRAYWGFKIYLVLLQTPSVGHVRQGYNSWHLSSLGIKLKCRIRLNEWKMLFKEAGLGSASIVIPSSNVFQWRKSLFFELSNCSQGLVLGRWKQSLRLMSAPLKGLQGVNKK